MEEAGQLTRCRSFITDQTISNKSLCAPTRCYPTNHNECFTIITISWNFVSIKFLKLLLIIHLDCLRHYRMYLYSSGAKLILLSTLIIYMFLCSHLIPKLLKKKQYPFYFNNLELLVTEKTFYHSRFLLLSILILYYFNQMCVQMMKNHQQRLLPYQKICPLHLTKGSML